MFGYGNRICPKIYTNIMAADVLAPGIARPSAAMLLTIIKCSMDVMLQVMRMNFFNVLSNTHL